MAALAMHRIVVVAIAASFPLFCPSAEPQSGPTTERAILESGGWRLVGDWTTPASGGAVPAALLLHRAAGSRAEYTALASALARRGIASLSLDLRGHGNSDNLGRFEPPYAENRGIIEGTQDDVRAALQWVASQERVNPDRIACVGASYSGEAVGEALREGGESVTAVVMLSPGSFSSESIALVDADEAAWLFIRTTEESEDSVEFIDAVFSALERGSETAEIRVIPGGGHATRMFETQSFIVEQIADWLAQQLGTSHASAQGR